MPLSPDRLYHLHDGLVRRCEVAGLTRSAALLANSLDEPVRARLRISRGASDHESIEVQVRELLRMGWPDQCPRPPVLDWLATAARQTEGTRHADYFREVHGEVCDAYECHSARLSVDADLTDEYEESVDEDESWDEDPDEDDSVPAGVTMRLNVGDLEPGKSVATERFDLHEDSTLTISLDADDLVDLFIVRDDEYTRWKNAVFFQGNLEDAAIWHTDGEMFMAGETIDFDLEEDDELEEFRLVVIHVGTEEARVQLELGLA